MAHRSSRRRRTTWSEEDARRVLDEWQRSGATLAAFARARGLVPERIAWWRKRLGMSRAARSPGLTLVPAAVVGLEPVVVLKLPGGVAIEVANASPSWVAAVARELTRSQP